MESPGTVAGLDPVAITACSKASVLVGAVDSGDLEGPRVTERRGALHVVDLAQLGDLPHTAGQLRDDLVLERPDLVDLDARGVERHAPGGGVLRFVDDLGHVQQRLRRNAAAIQAHAARVRRGVDE